MDFYALDVFREILHRNIRTFWIIYYKSEAVKVKPTCKDHFKYIIREQNVPIVFCVSENKSPTLIKSN